MGRISHSLHQFILLQPTPCFFVGTTSRPRHIAAETTHEHSLQHTYAEAQIVSPH